MIDKQIGSDILAIAKEINKYAKAIKDGDSPADKVRRHRAWLLIQLLAEHCDSSEKSDMQYELSCDETKTQNQRNKHSYSTHVYYKDAGRVFYEFEKRLKEFEKISVEDAGAKEQKAIVKAKTLREKLEAAAKAEKAAARKTVAKNPAAKKAAKNSDEPYAAFPEKGQAVFSPKKPVATKAAAKKPAAKKAVAKK